MIININVFFKILIFNVVIAFTLIAVTLLITRYITELYTVLYLLLAHYLSLVLFLKMKHKNYTLTVYKDCNARVAYDRVTLGAVFVVYRKWLSIFLRTTLVVVASLYLINRYVYTNLFVELFSSHKLSVVFVICIFFTINILSLAILKLYCKRVKIFEKVLWVYF